jgi:tRNA-splicing ligase RtcB
MTNHEFPVPLRGAKTETLLWAHEHDVEQAALQQLRAIGTLPWVQPSAAS